MAQTLVHAVPLPHFDLEKIVDQVCGCGRNTHWSDLNILQKNSHLNIFTAEPQTEVYFIRILCWVETKGYLGIKIPIENRISGITVI